MKILFFTLFAMVSMAVFAQQPAKRPLTINDFAGWEIISNSLVSEKGNLISYEQNPQKGDGKLYVVKGKQEFVFPRGEKAALGTGEDFVVFQIKQPETALRKAKIDKVKKEKMPKDSLAILVFKHDSLVKFGELKSYKISEENARFVAFTLQPGEAKKDTSKTEKPAKGKKMPEQPGDDLVLFNVKTADTTVFKNVLEYAWSKNGSSLCFISQTKDTATTTSVFTVFKPETGKASEIYRTPGFLKSATSSNDGNQFAFLASTDTAKVKNYQLYFGKDSAFPELVADSQSKGIPVGWSPSENGKIYFSENGQKLYFGTAETPEPEQKDTIPEDEKPVLDIWNWKDLKLQPQQKVELEREKKRTYLAVYHLQTKQLVQLEDIAIKEVTVNEKGNSNTGFGYDDSPYLRELSWTGERKRDFYLVDLETGIKREILKNQSYARLSPKGKYVIWYNPADSSFYSKSTDISKLEPVSLTKFIPVTFCEEQHDTPSDPNPYGIAGWSEDDRFVYIYDRYDIWKIDPSGEKVPVNVTKTFGRRNKTRLRYEKLDNELEHIPSNQNVLLSAFDERTMSSGYFETDFSAVKDPKMLIMDKYNFDNVKKAKNADKIIWTKENVAIFPDVWSGNLKFEHSQKISSANQQQKEFIWPDVELVEWTSFTGEKLQGLLYKPENLDSNKKYPMMVYFYERNAETLYRYQRPLPSHSTINKALYASNGYLVFVPDITYKTGYPGQSAYNAIVSGTQYLINKFPFVDKDKIALQGQSWGGYQTAYLITQTDMFAAAMAGAPVSNMTSAYGGIRWESGMSRMFQYEHTQSRIGGTLWEKPLHYIENSPLFYAPKINTPLLMMHNDNDGAVPWYQGIEFFVALRRLNKPVWLLSYNGEPHNLKTTSWANRVDLSTRMFQFFNHYLKGAPAPEWMEKGVAAVDKGEKLGY